MSADDVPAQVSRMSVHESTDRQTDRQIYRETYRETYPCARTSLFVCLFGAVPQTKLEPDVRRTPPIPRLTPPIPIRELV